VCCWPTWEWKWRIDDWSRDVSPVARNLAVAVLVALAAVTLAAPWLAPYDPSAAVAPPLTPPGQGHLLGTNDIGQDVWSQWLWGGRASLAIALLVTLISSVLSWSIGIATGLSWKAEGVLLAITDLLLAVPAFPLYLLVVALLGPSQLHLALALGLLSWAAFARIVRARVIGVRGETYVEAARALGAGPLRIALRHVAPATFELLPAKLVLTVRFAIFAEATLAFLGLGDAADRSWGSMLGWAFADPTAFIGTAWTWWVLPPALGIVAVVLATTLLSAGDDAPEAPRLLRATSREPQGAATLEPAAISGPRISGWSKLCAAGACTCTASLAGAWLTSSAPRLRVARSSMRRLRRTCAEWSKPRRRIPSGCSSARPAWRDNWRHRIRRPASASRGAGLSWSSPAVLPP
jgi:ABC-type dipeptide/oligopeptide/nickel transport system permease subunit